MIREGEPTENLQGRSVGEVWVEDYQLSTINYPSRKEGFRFGEWDTNPLRTHILNSSRGGDIGLAQKFHSAFSVNILWKNLNELLEQPNRIKHEQSGRWVRRGLIG